MLRAERPEVNLLNAKLHYTSPLPFGLQPVPNRPLLFILFPILLSHASIPFGVHGRYTACPEYNAPAEWEHKVAAPKGLPVDNAGNPLPFADAAAAPPGVVMHNAWRAPGGGGRAPSFQR